MNVKLSVPITVAKCEECSSNVREVYHGVCDGQFVTFHRLLQPNGWGDFQEGDGLDTPEARADKAAALMVDLIFGGPGAAGGIMGTLLSDAPVKPAEPEAVKPSPKEMAERARPFALPFPPIINEGTMRLTASGRRMLDELARSGFKPGEAIISVDLAQNAGVAFAKAIEPGEPKSRASRTISTMEDAIFFMTEHSLDRLKLTPQESVAVYRDLYGAAGPKTKDLAIEISAMKDGTTAVELSEDLPEDPPGGPNPVPLRSLGLHLMPDGGCVVTNKPTRPGDRQSSALYAGSLQECTGYALRTLTRAQESNLFG